MRLLSANSLQLHQFNDEGRLPPYAILSHTWGDQEVSLSDLESDNISLKSGFRKIEQACKQALIDGLEFVWVDTCCIDKGSSAELSEAINSMFRWYECASACYAYLEDVHWQPGLKGSRWFARGWTLQELIAPNEVYFYNSEWKTIGTRTELCSCIEEITSINQDVLTAHHRNLGHGTIGPLLASKSVAQRMAWAANRETTRPEDMAYSLLGLFDIHMPLIYGEGVNKAFTRLQAEILRDSADHSILAWSTESHISTITVDQPQSTPGGPIDPRDHVAVALATQPKLFALCKNIATILASDARPIEMTSRGLKIDL
ncbi:HET-domain-containing protein, partial [Karstenula rhodostoma CBS 690.94]